MKARTTGFTLAELMVTVTIAGTMLAIGVPAFAALNERMTTDADMSALTVSLAKARITAITRRHPVTACPSTDGETCRGDVIWDRGWIVYDDPDRRPQPATREAIIWRQEAPDGALAIRTTKGRHRVRYQPNGMAGGVNLTLTVCSRRTGKTLGTVTVNMGGRIRQEYPPATKPCTFDVSGGA